MLSQRYYLFNCFAALAVVLGVLFWGGGFDAGILLAWTSLGLGYGLFQWLSWRHGRVWSQNRELLALLGVIIWAIAVARCAGPERMSLLTALFFGSGALALAASAGLSQPFHRARRLKLERETWLTVLLLILTVILILSARWMLQSIQGVDPFLSHGAHLFFIPRETGGYSGFRPEVFHEWARLLPAGMLLFFFTALLPSLLEMPRSRALTVLFFLSIGIDLVVVFIASDGLGVLPLKIEAISNHYYSLVKELRPYGAWAFVTHFNEIQAQLGTHGDTHPFGPELFYWGLFKVFGANPAAHSAAIIVITSLGVLPLWLIVTELGASTREACAASLLFITAPVSTLLANAGIDCIVTLLFLVAIYGWLKARTGSWRWLLFTAAVTFACSLLSLATSYLLLFYVVFGFASGGRFMWRRYALLAGLVLAQHLALWVALKGSFNYLQVYEVASRIHVSADRPYDVWVWANVLLFLGYSGLGSSIEFIKRVARKVAGQLHWEPFLAATSVLLAVCFLQSLGHGQPQRIYQWLYPMICICAAGALSRSNFEEKSLLTIRLIVGLNFLNSVLLEMMVADLW